MKLFIVVIGVVALWVIITESKSVPAHVLPRPVDMVKSFRPQLLTGAASTTSRAISGFALGIGLACLLHLFCQSLGLTEYLDTQFAGARAVPMVAILPLFVIWFGFSEVGRLVLVTLTSAAFFIGPFHESFNVLPAEMILLKRQQRLSTSMFFWRIVIPGTVSSLLGPLRVCFAISFTIAIASEYVGAQFGIGKFLDSARVTFNVPAIFLCIFLASFIGIACDQIICRVFRRFVHWAGKDAKQ